MKGIEVSVALIPAAALIGAAYSALHLCPPPCGPRTPTWRAWPLVNAGKRGALTGELDDVLDTVIANWRNMP